MRVVSEGTPSYTPSTKSAAKIAAVNSFPGTERMHTAIETHGLRNAALGLYGKRLGVGSAL